MAALTGWSVDGVRLPRYQLPSAKWTIRVIEEGSVAIVLNSLYVLVGLLGVDHQEVWRKGW